MDLHVNYILYKWKNINPCITFARLPIYIEAKVLEFVCLKIFISQYSLEFFECRNSPQIYL